MNCIKKLRILNIITIIAAAFAAGASAAEVFIYSDRDNNTGFFFLNGGAANQSGNTITRLVADDLTPIPGYAGQAISNIYFSVYNNNGVAVSARPRLRLWNADGSGGGPGTLIARLTFNPITFCAGTAS